MFDEYARKLKNLGKDVPAIFGKVAARGAIHFRNVAVDNTNKKRVVDTGAYKSSWTSDIAKTDDKYSIICMNTIEYASFLEDGYNVAKAHFVPFKKMKGSPKTQRLIASFKLKYPNAKGFIAKPRRFKGLKIGRISVAETKRFVLRILDEEVAKAMKKK